ncbi:MAG: site-specific integrase [Ignavibacteriae bacterium]|nr:site-specific integrase [Ignavibacteriota bacterium]MCB9216627.1 phage integrase SAM-like domain-containing protein [Ignavibacteria bacterium]
MARLNKVSFYLARPKEKARTVILVRLRIDREQIRFGTGVSIYPKDWNPKSQRMKKNCADEVTVNTRLARIESDLKEIFLDLQNNRIEPTPELVKSRYEALIAKDASRNSDKSFFDFWEDWLDQTETSKTASTIQQNRTVMTKLKEYQEDRGAKITFDRLDREFFESFTRYLITIKKLTNSTIWNQVKRIKAFMQWAQERGLTTNEFYRNVKKKDFNVQPPTIVRLTESEFNQLLDFDFSETPYLENARNLFVLQSCLGVRVGDLLKIVKAPTHYLQNDSDSIRITSEKTRKEQVIPLNPRAKRILFSDTPPHHISDVKLNSYIKEAAKKAELNRNILKSAYTGKIRKESTIPLHDVISSHCAKRTFVSLMVASNVHIQVIADITGNTLETIKRYIDLDEMEIAREARKADSVFS